MSETSHPEPLTYTVEDGVAVVRLDDGKVNVISHRVIELFHEALDRSTAEASAVAIVGREGKLSAGFDLTEMTAGAEQAAALVGAGGRLLMRIYGHPQPVVLGVTGHALAAGALLTLSCDTRIGGDGPAKIGLNETAIGMGLPHYAVELAEARLAPTHLLRAAVQAEIYDAPGAVEAGYLDRVVPAADVAAVVVAEARRLGQLPGGAYRHTKLALHQAMIDRVLPRLDDDMRTMTGPST
jgi:enoyl-CoA hydratase